MPGIPEQIVDEIRDRCDIVEIIQEHVPLKRRGGEYWACCPFHQEKTPSFKVSPGRQAFYCFGCQKSGNVYTFVMERENLDFVGAVRVLARRAGVRIPDTSDGEVREGGLNRERLYDILEGAASWFQQQLRSEAGAVARRYLGERGLAGDAVATFGLGYAPDSWDGLLNWGRRRNYEPEALVAAGLAVEKEDRPGRVYDRFRGRLIFPIWNELGRVVGFSGRALDPDRKGAKYINTPETRVFKKSRLMYALHKARQAFRDKGCALVCEGQLDVIACHRAGLTHAVAPQGTAFTERQAAILKRYAEKVVFAFDADAAGRKAAVRSIGIALAAGLRPAVVRMPPGRDPDDIFRAEGNDGLQHVMSNAVDAFRFLLDVYRCQHDVDVPEGRAAVVDDMLAVIMRMNDPVARAARCQWLAADMNIPETVVFGKLKSMQNRSRRGVRHRREHEGEEATPVAPVLPSAAGREARVLLDLAVAHEFIAEQLAERVSSERLHGSSPGNALEFFLHCMLEKGWERAVHELLARPDLISRDNIGDVLHNSRFSGLDPAEAKDEKERLRRRQLLVSAMNDCLARFEKTDIETEMARLKKAMDAEDDVERLRALIRKYQNLARRKHGIA